MVTSEKAPKDILLRALAIELGTLALRGMLMSLMAELLEKDILHDDVCAMCSAYFEEYLSIDFGRALEIIEEAEGIFKRRKDSGQWLRKAQLFRKSLKRWITMQESYVNEAEKVLGFTEDAEE